MYLLRSLYRTIVRLVLFLSLVTVLALFVEIYKLHGHQQSTELKKRPNNGELHSSHDNSLQREIIARESKMDGLSRLLTNFKVAHENNGRAMITLEEFRSGRPTGNILIDGYGKNNLSYRGEMGQAVTLNDVEKAQARLMYSKFNVNTVASDATPLNRLVPDSRLKNCDQLQYDTQLLPSASVIIPFYDEYLSFLLRTVYSVINRTPRNLLEEIILVDDGSTLDELQNPLDMYIKEHFPQGLIRLLRNENRSGLIYSRMRGCRAAVGEVLVIFDSHMEVNTDWLQPLLNAIVKDRNIAAMASLDYINSETLQYTFYNELVIRYGWSWRLAFFEEYFRWDQVGHDPRSPRNGVAMVGAGFAINKKFFFDIGGYDESMLVWGGENLELSWRIWMCGGRLLHIPCSNIGHVARGQPYSFPKGRQQTEHFNYKRAISVWMGHYSKYVYDIYPDMKTLDVGDLTDRLELKEKLRCKNFTWYIKNIWPELTIFDEDVIQWGRIRNKASDLCLDSNHYWSQYGGELQLKPCLGPVDDQGFSLTTDHSLRASLQCVVCRDPPKCSEVQMMGCFSTKEDKWDYTEEQQIIHRPSKFCLDVVNTTVPVLRKCSPALNSQKWLLVPYTF